ncbi:MAG: hypothetical protein ACJ71W_21930 [Terriglobales bacterium]
MTKDEAKSWLRGTVVIVAVSLMAVSGIMLGAVAAEWIWKLMP